MKLLVINRRSAGFKQVDILNVPSKNLHFFEENFNIFWYIFYVDFMIVPIN